MYISLRALFVLYLFISVECQANNCSINGYETYPASALAECLDNYPVCFDNFFYLLTW